MADKPAKPKEIIYPTDPVKNLKALDWLTDPINKQEWIRAGRKTDTYHNKDDDEGNVYARGGPVMNARTYHKR